MMSAGKFGRYRADVAEIIERMERLALGNKVKSDEEHFEIYGGSSEGIGMKSYLHSPVDFTKTLKLRFRVADLDLPESRNRYTNQWVGGGRRSGCTDRCTLCPCGEAIGSRTQDNDGRM